ncbi:MAG: two pore domain potassium channel family protein, partial [Theionarchaea archaeon]|nr:two pore domain potassium channel family protein [Theionarchaea archaeon]
VILLVAVLFFFSGVARVGADIPSVSNPYIIDYSLDCLSPSWTMLTDFYYCFYYSVVTFTTLGYGDIHPIGHLSHAIAFSEAFTGAFFIALFVVVFARKMMR